MLQKLSQKIEKFQQDVNDLKKLDIFLVGVGLDENDEETIIATSSIDDPKTMLSGLAQLCSDDHGFYTLFKLAIEIADRASKEEPSND